MLSNIIKLDTEFGIFDCFSVKENHKEHLVLCKGSIEKQECLVRIHSECLTGDLFKSKRCDCGDQLSIALKTIAKEGGILIYLRQEGRDIGLFNKIKAYKLQDQGFDTIEANLELGLPIDNRKYDTAAKILKALAPSKIRLMTNNPHKLDALRKMMDIPIERISISSEANASNAHYLNTKILKMNNLMEQQICPII